MAIAPVQRTTGSMARASRPVGAIDRCSSDQETANTATKVRPAKSEKYGKKRLFNRLQLSMDRLRKRSGGSFDGRIVKDKCRIVNVAFHNGKHDCPQISRGTP